MTAVPRGSDRIRSVAARKAKRKRVKPRLRARPPIVRLRLCPQLTEALTSKKAEAAARMDALFGATRS